MNQAVTNNGALKVTVNSSGAVVPYTSPGALGRAGVGVGGATSAPDTPDNPFGGTPGYTSGGSGGGSTGGGGGSTTPDLGPTDWSSMLGIYGLPTDVQNKVNQIFASTSDVNQATALAMAYIRGTNWYAQTYPGIQEGIARGVINNEADYRSYVNQLQQMNRQFYNTDITSQQIANYLKAGYSVGHVQNLFQGHAYAVANKDNLDYLLGAFGNGQLSNNDLETFGQEKAGLDSVMGLKLQNLVQKAQQRMQNVFNGSLATPSLAIGNNGLQSPSLAGTKQSADVAAA